MSDNITLPREVVQLALEAFEAVMPFSTTQRELKIRAVDALRKALAAEQPKHPGYIIGSHWLETAYSRICAGEAEADVLRDCGLVRITDGMAETADIHAIVDRQEALRRDAERLKTDAEMMRWLIDNHTAWSWNPSPYNTDVIGGFAAFSTGYLGFDLKTAIRKAMQDSALQEDKT